MIFVTVGTQLPFDRMISTIDAWAAENKRADVFAQVGPATYRPTHIQYSEFLPADACRQKIEQASVVIAHAGMGSIITALELGKPIIVMPRRSELGEHRNNHQISTAKKFLEQGTIHVAMDEQELLQRLLNIDSIESRGKVSNTASPQLLNALKDFVQRGKLPGRVIVSAPATSHATGDFRPAGQTYR
jgi:UDP-N-acetylglucosamine transferase subunit ALG13